MVSYVCQGYCDGRVTLSEACYVGPEQEMFCFDCCMEYMAGKDAPD